MSQRAGLDWSPLGWHEDPVPGDPDIVAGQVQIATETTKRLEQAAMNLRRLSGGEMCSEAIEKITAHARELAKGLDHAADRYDGLSRALSSYEPHLRHAQSESLQALRAAEPAARQAKTHKATVKEKYWAAASASDPETRTRLVDEMTQANSQLASANGAVEAAKSRLRLAISERDSAARVAEQTIRDNIDGSPLNDSAWDKFKDFVAPALEVLKNIAQWVWDNIEIISLVLSIVAPLLAWVPVLGQVLMVLNVAAKALAAIKSVYQVGSAVVKASQSGDWSGVLMLLAASAASKLVPKFVGKLAAKAAARLGAKAGAKATMLVGNAMKGHNAAARRRLAAGMDAMEGAMKDYMTVSKRTVGNKSFEAFFERAAARQAMRDAANQLDNRLLQERIFSSKEILKTSLEVGVSVEKAVKGAPEAIADFGMNHVEDKVREYVNSRHPAQHGSCEQKAS